MILETLDDSSWDVFALGPNDLIQINDFCDAQRILSCASHQATRIAPVAHPATVSVTGGAPCPRRIAAVRAQVAGGAPPPRRPAAARTPVADSRAPPSRRLAVARTPTAPIVTRALAPAPGQRDRENSPPRFRPRLGDRGPSP